MTSSHSISRIQGLDGLRGLSIALVLVAHAGFGHLVPGGFGVTIFFFISGFIITSLLLKEFSEANSISLREFYIRRAFRILPVLFVYLACTTAYIFWVTREIDAPQLVAALLFYYNYYFLWFDPHVGEFGKFHPYSIVWSLAVEEHFYLAFPVLLCVFIRRLRLLLLILCLACLAALVWRAYLVFGVGLEGLPYSRIYKATDTRFDAIVFGVVFAISRHLFGVRVMHWTSGRGSLVLGLLLLLVSLIIRNENFRESLRYTLQGVGLFVLFGGVLSSSAIASRVLSNHIFLYLGKISYSLYLWHWFVYVVMQRIWDPNDSVLAACFMILISILISHVSQIYIEKPALGWRAQFTTKLSRAQ